jgi:hypothetical protein
LIWRSARPFCLSSDCLGVYRRADHRTAAHGRAGRLPGIPAAWPGLLQRETAGASRLLHPANIRAAEAVLESTRPDPS